MPYKKMSKLTSQEFIEYKGALGFNRKELAAALNRKGATITGYENGQGIPEEVVERLRDLVRREREKIKARDGVLISIDAGLGSLIVHQNTVGRQHKPPRLHQALGRFARKQRKPDTRLLPLYRMTRERFMVYVQALSRWQLRVRELAREYTDEARQRDYTLELADLKAMAASAPRAAPYDVCIQHNEWDVVSRALRHLATDPKFYAQAHALRTHWGKHKHTGYISHRKYTKEQS